MKRDGRRELDQVKDRRDGADPGTVGGFLGGRNTAGNPLCRPCQQGQDLLGIRAKVDNMRRQTGR